MKVLFDLNVVLDVVLNRQPWVADSRQVWDAHLGGSTDGYLAATGITNLFYIVRRLVDESTARSAVGVCLSTFSLVPVDLPIMQDADQHPGTDFEDNVCIACAEKVEADWIVTRDPSGFMQSSVPAISPTELLKKISRP
jgi:predicted nucleic acid-binding protein